MPAPQEQVRVGGCDVILVGTIPGFVPDGDRVRTTIANHDPDLVCLGVPPEDVDSLQALAADPSLADGLEPDELDDFMLDVLSHWGEVVAVPSPDLAAAAESELPIVGVDMDDATHTDRFTELVKVRHLVQRGSARKKVRGTTADSASDPYALVCLWDRMITSVKPLGELEALRSEAIASGIQDACREISRAVAVVPAARYEDVLQRLRNKGQA